MALTAGDIIIQARSLEPGFTEQRHSDSVCLTFLDRFQRTLLLEVSQIDPAAYQSSFQISLPWADIQNGEQIPNDYLRIAGMQTWDNADERYIITTWARYADRLRNFYVPAVYIANRYIIPTEKDPKLWIPYGHIKVDYVPLPPAISTSTDQLFFEDESEDCYVAGVASFMANRSSPEEQNVPAAAFAGEYLNQLRRFLDRYAFDGGVQVTQMEEIW